MNALCPICHTNCQVLHSLAFPEKLNLPQRISISVCATCDFAFSTPRDSASYNAFYSANLNDALGSDINMTEAEKNRYSGQMSVLQPFLNTSRRQRVLDVGCGQAGLLRTIRKHFPNHSYFAVDPNIGAAQVTDPGIHLADDWKKLDGSFDLIILSHVIEHVVDFDDIAQLSKRLTATGHIYIEVPDASQYCNYLRREFLYYFDRLHINHFTGHALSLLVGQWGLHAINIDRSEFEYKDGQPYPAIYVVATRQESPTYASPLEAPLQGILQSYVASELTRALAIRQKLVSSQSVVVYGFGDNFFKSAAIGGPLDGIPIAAIIDMRHSALNQSPYANTYRFLGIDACCTEYPDSTYVVAVSWGNLEVRLALQDRGIRNVALI